MEQRSVLVVHERTTVHSRRCDDGTPQRYRPEVTFRGCVEHRNSQYALYAAACMRGGLQPDLLSDAGWWQTPPVAVRGVRRRHLQPRGGGAAGGTSDGGHSTDRRSARPPAHRDHL
jgi:hypothetical protein